MGFAEDVAYLLPSPLKGAEGHFGFKHYAVPASQYYRTKNVAKHCFSAYTAFWVLLDNDLLLTDRGDRVIKVASTHCPSIWLAKWDAQRRRGTFAGYVNPPGSPSRRAADMDEAIRWAWQKEFPVAEELQDKSEDDVKEWWQGKINTWLERNDPSLLSKVSPSAE